MIYGGLYPMCHNYKSQYNVTALADSWKSTFNLKCDIVIEGGGNGAKRVVNLNSIHKISTETVYIGDSYISGNVHSCKMENADKSDFNYN